MSMALDLNFGVSDPVRANNASHPNPMFDYLTGFVPRKLKDLLKWAEYLSVNSAHIYAVVRKFGEYPITRVLYETNSVAERDRHKDLYEKVLRLKGFLTKVSFDKYVYGNVFISLYEPFKRELICKHCKTHIDISVADYTFDLDKLAWKLRKCTSCGGAGIADCLDTKLVDKKKLELIRWDPKLIDIDHNPITGKSVYYYQIPRNIIQQVRSGNKNLIDLMPIEILRAMQRKKTFRFAEGQLYHMRTVGPAGVEAHWGLPPITSAIKNFLFAATLRKANEAIALEHITPFRIVTPKAGSGNGDPITTINLQQLRDEYNKAYKEFRRDPLYQFFSPAPIDVVNVGGEGRALLTLGELQEAEKNIVLSMGVPMEFLSGGLGQTRGEITLRMIENQLQTHIEELNDLLQWVEDKISAFLNWTTIEVKLADFKMIDDVENKQMLAQLWQAGKLDDTTMYESLNLDPERIRKQKIEDALADARAQMEQDAQLAKQKNSLSSQAQQQALQGQSQSQYDQQAIIAQADQIVQEFMQMDAGTRRSRMDALKNEDLVMASVVRERLEQVGQNQEADMKAQQKGAAFNPFKATVDSLLDTMTKVSAMDPTRAEAIRKSIDDANELIRKQIAA
jgi:hypothetical protein